MSEVKDDPREVLVILNSLGFVGITAAQLKGFMKDLKTYRKVKEREKQQRKEEIKTKIINKQQALIRETYGYQNTEYSSRNDINVSESSNSFDDDESLLKVRIRCIPKEQVVETQKHPKVTTVKSDEKLTKHQKQDIASLSKSANHHEHNFNIKHASIRRTKSESRQDISKSSGKTSLPIEKYRLNTRLEEQYKPVNLQVNSQIIQHPINERTLLEHASRTRSKSVTLDSPRNVRAQSALSARSSANFRHKSFIRPWRLQPETQKNVINKKCDPVALYQKYQQEWKQISFPGEATHSRVRWAVREKMLGIDPHPTSLPRKSMSMPILRKK